MLRLMDDGDAAADSHPEHRTQFSAPPPSPPHPLPRHRWPHDLAIRLAGLSAVAFATGLTSWLHRLILATRQQSGTPGQYAIAAIALLSASVGVALMGLGRHVHDEIPLSDRWRTRA